MTIIIVKLGKKMTHFMVNECRRLIQSRAFLMTCTCIKHGCSAKASLMTGELVATGVDKTSMPKFKTDVDKKQRLAYTGC